MTYTLPEGETVTVPAIRGWVSLVGAVGATPDQVGAIAASAGAKVIEANAKVGLYTLSVSPGKEGDLIARLRQERWVVEASPAFFLKPVQQPEKPVKAIDFPVRTLLDPVTSDTCGNFHGNLTAAQIAKAGGRVEIIDVLTPGKGGQRALDTPWASSIANKLLEAMETSSVVNLSIGAPNTVKDKATGKDVIDPATGQPMKVVGAAYRHWQGAFLATVFAVAEQGADVPVIVSAGNGDGNGVGQNLTRYLEALRKQFPNAAKRVRIVEALDKDGKRTKWSDFSDVGSIQAPGENVPIESTGIRGAPTGVQECSGTSFAAPIVSGLMDGLKKAVPGKPAGDLWNTFDKVTRRQVPWTWERANLPRQLVNEVTGKRVLSVLLDPPSASVQEGKNILFAPVLRDADGRLVTNLPASSFTWSTSNPSATVDGSGLVVGRAPGTVVVSVTVEGLRATATVTVTPPAVASVQLDPPAASVQQGKNVLFAVVLRDADGRLVTDVPASSFTWSSANPAVATVDRAGFVDGRSPGTTVVSVVVEGIRASAPVTVTPAATQFAGPWVGTFRTTYGVPHNPARGVPGEGCTSVFSGNVRFELTQAGTKVTGTVTDERFTSISLRCVIEGRRPSTVPVDGEVSGDTLVLRSFYLTWTMTRTSSDTASGTTVDPSLPDVFTSRGTFEVRR